jgi:hypothetical protein
MLIAAFRADTCVQFDESPNESFLAMTPNGVVVTCTPERWRRIIEKHPVLVDSLEAIRNAIEDPVEIRRSRWAPDIWLCYRRHRSRWLCAVVAPASELLVTAYPTDAVKSGDVLWTPYA